MGPPGPGFMPPPVHAGGFAPPPQPQQYGTGYDAEDPMGAEPKGFEFNDESIRKNFIKKVLINYRYD